MSENTEPDDVVIGEAGETVFEQPKFTGTLRDLLKQRVEAKIRRVHKQWFCLDPEVQAELDQVSAEFAERYAKEAFEQQATRSEGKPGRKYAASSSTAQLGARVDELRAKSRESGVMGVFQNLTGGEIDEALDIKDSFGRARKILMQAFMHWETSDGAKIDPAEFGVDDLDELLKPEVLEQGEWLPLASKIIQESSAAPDRPTLPTR